jgi:hypothetical protein
MDLKEFEYFSVAVLDIHGGYYIKLDTDVQTM